MLRHTYKYTACLVFLTIPLHSLLFLIRAACSTHLVILNCVICVILAEDYNLEARDYDILSSLFVLPLKRREYPS